MCRGSFSLLGRCRRLMAGAAERGIDVDVVNIA